MKDVVTERTHWIKAYSPRKKNSKKLRSRTLVCKLLSFVEKARILSNSHRLKGTTYYVNKDFSKETVAYKERIMRKGKSFEERRSSCLFKLYKSIVDKEKNDPQVWVKIIGLINMITKSSTMPPNSSFES